jgi:GNAT superfamily N-acetyltransferase
MMASSPKPEVMDATDASRLEGAAAVLARAFRDYPMMRYVLPDEGRRARVLPGFLGPVVCYCLSYGGVYTTANLDGVACWLPPGAGASNPWRLIRSGMIFAPARIGPVAFGRFLGPARRMEAVHRSTVREPHWYLWAFGVEPGRQGGGIGGALLEPVLARADAGGTPCYLETHTGRNVRFYEKHGFEVAEEIEGHGPRAWAMLRAPLRASRDPHAKTAREPEATRKADA